MLLGISFHRIPRSNHFEIEAITNRDEKPFKNYCGVVTNWNCTYKVIFLLYEINLQLIPLRRQLIIIDWRSAFFSSALMEPIFLVKRVSYGQLILKFLVLGDFYFLRNLGDIYDFSLISNKSKNKRILNNLESTALLNV